MIYLWHNGNKELTIKYKAGSDTRNGRYNATKTATHFVQNLSVAFNVVILSIHFKIIIFKVKYAIKLEEISQLKRTGRFNFLKLIN